MFSSYFFYSSLYLFFMSATVSKSRSQISRSSRIYLVSELFSINHEGYDKMCCHCYKVLNERRLWKPRSRFFPIILRRFHPGEANSKPYFTNFLDLLSCKANFIINVVLSTRICFYLKTNRFFPSIFVKSFSLYTCIYQAVSVWKRIIFSP